jgi:hypothetical protein
MVKLGMLYGIVVPTLMIINENPNNAPFLSVVISSHIKLGYSVRVKPYIYTYPI